MKHILIILIFVLLTSCGANYHLKRARKHLLKAEQLGAEINRDTVYKTIHVVTPLVSVDTIVKYHSDTIEVTRDKIKVRLKIDTLTKEVYLKAECLPDTVKLTVPVGIQTEIKPGRFMDSVSLFLLGIVTGFLLCILIGKIWKG